MPYYDGWKHDSTSFDETRLRGLLSSAIEFEGLLAGTTQGIEPFVRGLEMFARGVKALTVIHTIPNGNDVAVLCDCNLTMPVHTFKFADWGLHLTGAY